MGIVPFDEDKKLSAKRVFNREALRNVQEDLPKHLQEKGFDIKRGLEGSDRKNLTVPEFKELKEKEKEIEREIYRKKNELKAYTQENKIPNKIGEEFYRYIFPNNQNEGEYSGDYSKLNAIYLYEDERDKGTERRLIYKERVRILYSYSFI